MIRMLVSVKNVSEALAAAAAGADFVDLKDPAQGALGGLGAARIAPIVAALRSAHAVLPISATIGDVAVDRFDDMLRRVDAVAACGVDYVKVGVEPGPAAQALLTALARSDAPVVPVLLADAGIEAGLVDAALAHDAFGALMLDIADKGRGSLLARVPKAVLADFISRVRRRGVLVGLAGALTRDDLPALRELAPDFAGFRSAVCLVGRDGPLDAERVRALHRTLRTAAPALG